jgi:hypothetical protein
MIPDKEPKAKMMSKEGECVEVSEPLLEEAQRIGAVEPDRVPEWREQITIRGLAVSAGLLGFFFVKTWTSFLSKLGFSIKPFTKQENTVIQTCVVACYGLAFSGNPYFHTHYVCARLYL